MDICIEKNIYKSITLPPTFISHTYQGRFWGKQKYSSVTTLITVCTLGVGKIDICDALRDLVPFVQF